MEHCLTVGMTGTTSGFFKDLSEDALCKSLITSEKPKPTKWTIGTTLIFLSFSGTTFGQPLPILLLTKISQFWEIYFRWSTWFLACEVGCPRTWRSCEFFLLNKCSFFTTEVFKHRESALCVWKFGLHLYLIVEILRDSRISAVSHDPRVANFVAQENAGTGKQPYRCGLSGTTCSMFRELDEVQVLRREATDLLQIFWQIFWQNFTKVEWATAWEGRRLTSFKHNLMQLGFFGSLFSSKNAGIKAWWTQDWQRLLIHLHGNSII